MTEFLRLCKALGAAETEADLDPILTAIDAGDAAGTLSRRDASDLLRVVHDRLAPKSRLTLEADKAAAVKLVEMWLAQERRPKTKE